MALGMVGVQGQTFQTGRMFSMPVHPNSVAAGDFNEDGIVDLAVPSWSPNKVTIALGDGNGGVSSSTSFDGSSASRFAIVSDFNNDGLDDVATANETAGDVSIFLGTGTGALTFVRRVASGAGCYHLAAVNLNGDAAIDLIVANSGAGNIGVLLGLGGGNFAPVVTYAVGTGPRAVQPGDFNGDGQSDVAVANYGSQNVSVLYGNGSGAFGAPSTLSVGLNPHTMAAGDINEDGRLDVVVPNSGSGTVTLLMGHPVSGLVVGSTISVGRTPRAVVVQDLDADNHLDLAVANRDNNTVTLLRGNGAGGFTSSGHVGVGSGPFSLVAADMNGDSVIDIVTSDRDGNTLSIVPGLGSMNFAGPYANFVGTNPRGVAAADLDGDGIRDVVVANTSSHTVSVLRGAGAGKLMVPVHYTTGSSPYLPTIADVSGDGIPDIIVANSGNNNVSVLRGNGSGGFLPHVRYGAGSGVRAAIVLNLNADSTPDLVTANFGGGTVSVLLGTGSGVFSAATAYAAGAGTAAIVAADFNEDGFVDVATANSTAGTVAILLGSGSGAFGAPATFAAGSTPSAIAAGDFDNDGNVDVTVANENGNAITVLRGNGAGGVLSTVSMASGIRPLGVAVGDVTGDSILDIVTANATSQTLAVHRGVGNGTFHAPGFLPAGAFSRAVALADMDGDSQLDIAVANANGNDAWVLLNRSGALADLSVAISNGVASVTRGDALTYTVTIANLGPSPITALNLQLNIPAALESVSVTPSAGVYNTGSGLLDGINLASGGNVTVSIQGTVSATASGTLAVSANVAASGVLDPISANNSASDSDLILQGNADLTVVVSNGASTIGAGDPVTYTIVVQNNGPVDVSGGEIQVQLPAQLQSMLWSCVASGGAQCVTEGSVPIANGVAVINEELEIPAGGTLTLTLTGTVDPLAAAGVLTLSAAVQVPNDVIDPNAANNSATDSDTLTGNSAPVANAQSVSVNEDGSVLITLTGTDADADPLTFSIDAGAAHGSLVGTLPNLTYTPDANYHGPDAFTFRVSDGTHSSTAVISITVQSVNDAPVAAGASFVTNEDAPLGITLGGADTDGDPLTFIIVTPPSLGTLTGSGASRTYTPAANASGNDSFVYAVSDGTTQSPSATITIQVNAVNDTPTVVAPIADQNVTGEGTSVVIELGATFSDVETAAGSLVLSALSSDPTLAAVVLTGTSLELQLDPNRGGIATITVRGTDADGAFVEDSFLITVSRGGAAITVSDPSVTEGATGGLVFTLTLSGPSAETITVNYATLNDTAIAGLDYTGVSGTATFAPGVVSRTVSVPTSGDLLDESNETVRLALSSPVGAALGDGEGVGTIVDNDTSSLRILDTTITEGDSGSSIVSFTVTISTPNASEVSVIYNTANISSGAIAGQDYLAVGGTVIFPAGSTISQTIAVPVLGDLVDEVNEAFNVVLSGPVNAVLDRAVGRATITDDDLPPSVSMSDVSVTEGDSGTKAMIFTATLSGPSGVRTRVRYTTANGTATSGSDYVAGTGEIVFDPGVTTRTISVILNGNTVAEPDETVLVNLHTPSLLTISDAQAVGTIVNDDAP